MTSASVLANGTVTALGSVYIDGQAYDDSSAKVLELAEDGSYRDSSQALAMGMRVKGAHNGRSGASSKPLLDSVVLENAVCGRVSAVNVSGFEVLGQTITINTDSSAGPVTVFAGNATVLADIAVSDWVEVYESRGTSGQIAATRISEQDP